MIREAINTTRYQISQCINRLMPVRASRRSQNDYSLWTTFGAFLLYYKYIMNEQITTSTSSHVGKLRNRDGLKIFVVILLFLIAIAGVGYSVYFWQQNKNLQTDVNNKSTQIHDLNIEVNSLESANAINVESNQNVIPIRELGISITVPDSISDLTYSYSSHITETSITKTVGFSTQAITDEYAGTNVCASYDSAPPLGTFYKLNGTYPNDSTYSPVLVKQTASYYIAYQSPQADCAINQSGTNSTYATLTDFKNSLSTVKEL